MKPFLISFEKTTGLNHIEAAEQWANYSRQLSDKDRLRIEQGGRAAGERMGQEFRRHHPANTQAKTSGSTPARFFR